MPSYRATVNLRFPVGTGGGTNTWHFRTDQPLGIEDEVDTIMGWVRSFYDGVKSLVPVSWVASWDGQFTEILTDSPGYSQPRAPWEVAGTAAGSSYGAAAGMACVTWRTELAARSGRGRTFIGPLSSTSVQTDGSLTPAALTSARAAGAALVSASNTNDGVGAVGVFSPTDNVIRDIVAATVTDQVAILRSRRG